MREFLFCTDVQWVTTVLAMVGKLGISAAFVAIYLLSAELFPTVVRNLGMGCSSTVGRLGSGVSPYIADLVSATRDTSPPLLLFLLL